MHRRVCTDKSLSRGVFAHKVFTHKKRLRTEKLSHAEASAWESLYTEKLLHAETFTLRSFYA